MNVRHKLTIRPGPNNPVGLVWIDLTAPTYGIHGTPEPTNIGKTESHGCIRLTNWDAVDLAAMVRSGTVVKFDDEDSPVANVPGPVGERRGLKIKRGQPWMRRKGWDFARSGTTSPAENQIQRSENGKFLDEGSHATNANIPGRNHNDIEFVRRADDLGVGLVGQRRREQPAAPAANSPALVLGNAARRRDACDAAPNDNSCAVAVSSDAVGPSAC